MASSWFLFFSYHNDARSNKYQIRKCIKVFRVALATKLMTIVFLYTALTYFKMWSASVACELRTEFLNIISIKTCYKDFEGAATSFTEQYF